jgi:hypothetical protein
MKGWLETLGAHIAIADRQCVPTVVVVTQAQVAGATVTFALTSAQRNQTAKILEENDQVAVAPGQLGSVRAPYQFKGSGRLQGDRLVVEVQEIYSTKPGPESAVRLDVMGQERMQRWEEARWTDLPPSGGPTG